MQVALTGATGFIGSRLVDRLLKKGHTLRILTRRRHIGFAPAEHSNERVRWFFWDVTASRPPRECLEGADAIVNLAGEPVAQRWSGSVKNKIRASRVEGTGNLVAAMRELSQPPRVLVNASAIGIYGARGNEVLAEDSSPGSDFLARVCLDWEQAAREAEEFGTRVVLLRNGIVLGQGGALQKMLPVFRAGLGGRLGSGKQWMSWVHVEDSLGLIDFALGCESLRGPVNGTAPNPVTNAAFTQQLAELLHRPTLFAVPPFVLRLLFGEMASVMLASQRVLPVAAKKAGYVFAFPELPATLQKILGKSKNPAVDR